METQYFARALTGLGVLTLVLLGTTPLALYLLQQVTTFSAVPKVSHSNPGFLRPIVFNDPAYTFDRRLQYELADGRLITQSSSEILELSYRPSHRLVGVITLHVLKLAHLTPVPNLKASMRSLFCSQLRKMYQLPLDVEVNKVTLTVSDTNSTRPPLRIVTDCRP